MATTPVDVSPEATLLRVQELAERWRDRSQGNQDLLSRPGTPPATLLTAWGLAAHVHRMAEATLLLLPEFGTEAAPLVRAQYETAVTAQWIVLRGPKALPGWLNEGIRQRVNLGQSMRGAGWANMTDELIEKLSNEQVPESGLESQARSFQKIVSDFQGSETIYSMYRFLCSFTHPSATVVDEYVTDDPSVATGLRLMMRSKWAGGEVWPWLMQWGLVWAGSSIDSLTKKSPDRFFYGEMARRCGMASARLELTPEAERHRFLDGYAASKRRPSGPA